MKRYLVFILCLFLTQVGAAQSNSDTYELKIDFEPAFIKPSQVIIEKSGNTTSLTFKIFDSRRKDVLEESNGFIKRDELKTLEEFLKTYEFKIKGSIDTVGAVKEVVIGDSVVKFYDITLGTDGVNVKGTLTQNADVKQFAFWSPTEGTVNAEFVNMLNKILEQTVVEEDVINYVENLQQYFPHKLGLKKISKTPLTYKLYGSISDSEANELYDFLENLPVKEKVIIDMSNFGGMGTMFYSDFEEYCVGKKNIYWLNPSSNALVDLHKIGIKSKYIISKKGG